MNRTHDSASVRSTRGALTPTAETESRAAAAVRVSHVTSRPLVDRLGRVLAADDSIGERERQHAAIPEASATSSNGYTTRLSADGFSESVRAGAR